MKKSMRIVIAVLLGTVLFFALYTIGFSAGDAQNSGYPLHNLKKSDIIKTLEKFRHNGLRLHETRYKTAPSTKAPYKAGTLRDEDVADALSALKAVRYLAGVPHEDVKFLAKFNDYAQHGATLLAANGEVAHDPKKPADMNEAFYEKARLACANSNLYGGIDNISDAILGWTASAGSANISSVGHRRWILSCNIRDFGIGYAEKFSALYVKDISAPGFSTQSLRSYIAWPNSGDFPLDYFQCKGNRVPWSFMPGSDYKIPADPDISVEMVRSRDQKKWTFTRATKNLTGNDLGEMHFYVDRDQRGYMPVITFRPDMKTLGSYGDGDTFQITVKGLLDQKGNSAAPVTYTTAFFKLDGPEENPAAQGSSDKDSKGKISVARLSVTAKNRFWTGSRIKSAPTVKYGTKALRAGTDYTLSHGVNKNIGKATVTIRGKGGYTGKKTIAFKIKPRKLSVKGLKVGRDRIVISWKRPNAAQKLSGIQVRYRMAKTAGWTVKTLPGKVVSMTARGLITEKRYQFQVRAFKWVGKVRYVCGWSPVRTSRKN